MLAQLGDRVEDYSCEAAGSALGMRPPTEYRASPGLTPHLVVSS